MSYGIGVPILALQHVTLTLIIKILIKLDLRLKFDNNRGELTLNSS